VLQYYQELSNVDAAEVMEVSVEALESLLARARRRLRLLLADDGHDS
jgi:RNA polymerase sigma-70 factor (ECF subfamily)